MKVKWVRCKDSNGGSYYYEAYVEQDEHVEEMTGYFEES